MNSDITDNGPIPTTPPVEPDLARLEATAGYDAKIVTVYDHAIVGERCIVRSAAGEGYWHVLADSVAAGDAAQPLGRRLRTPPDRDLSFPRR